MSWLNSMLKDSCDGSVSSKRVITLLAFIMCSAAFIAELGWGMQVTSDKFDSMMYIVIAGLGFTASEKFARNKEQ